MTKRREQVSDEAWRKGIDDLEAVFLRLLWLCNGDPYEIEDAVAEALDGAREAWRTEAA